MRIEARSKINWTLDITGQRPDGYHLMDMLMQPITLSDMIELHPADGIHLSVSGNPQITADQTNLVWRAAAALQQYTGTTQGAEITVQKQIPSGAGLGGGSADAAGTLAGLNRLWKLGLSEAQLEQIGLTLGADVPFCLRGGLARVTGIGEQIESLSDAPEWPLVIIQPCGGLSTGAVFKAYHASSRINRPDTEAAKKALLQHSLSSLSPSLGNALESVSCDARPEILDAIKALQSEGAICAAMSGSGSAVYGAFDSERIAAAAAEKLRTRWERTFLCRSCRHSVLITE